MNKKKKIFFRADAGSAIGYGHFIRTLALADMLKDDFDCTFFTQIPTEFQKSEAEKVCKLIALPEDDSKFEIFIKYLSGDEIVVLDNYFFTTDYQRQIKAKGCKLVCIDDMHDKHYVADVVINHALTDHNLFDVAPYTKLCLGFDWALLRKPFLNAAKITSDRTYSEEIRRVAVCFGGSDFLNLTEKVVQQLLRDSSITQIDAIVGSQLKNFEVISDTRVSLFQNVSAQHVADIFCKCDLAIVSASTVCIEALACGARVAAGWYVENQKEIYNSLFENNHIIGLSEITVNPFPIIDSFKSPILSPYLFTNIKNNYVSLFTSCKQR